MTIGHSSERVPGKWGRRVHRAGAVLLASFVAAVAGFWAWSHVAAAVPDAPALAFVDVFAVVAVVVALAFAIALAFGAPRRS